MPGFGVSSMPNHEMGTMIAAGTASTTITWVNESPQSKEPLYCLPFMPIPTTATAAICPMVRVR